MELRERSLYDRIGAEKIQILVDRFYELVFNDEHIAHLFKTDKNVIKEKQRLFLTQFLGGPPLYSEQYGHPKLRARHLPHIIENDDAVAWLSCMSKAIKSLDIDDEMKDELFKRFIPNAMFMVNSGDQG